MKICRYCLAEIPKEARRCSHCAGWQKDEDLKLSTEYQTWMNINTIRGILIFWLVLSIFGLIGAVIIVLR